MIEHDPVAEGAGGLGTWEGGGAWVSCGVLMMIRQTARLIGVGVLVVLCPVLLANPPTVVSISLTTKMLNCVCRFVHVTLRDRKVISSHTQR